MTRSPVRHLWNIGFLTGSSAVARGFFFLTTILIYKAMSMGEAGRFGFLYAVTTTAAFLTELGLRGYMVREISRRREFIEEANELYSTAITTRLFSFPLQIGISLAAVVIAGYPQSACAAILLCVAAWSESTSQLVKSAFRSHERMGWEAFTSISFKALLAAGAVWLFHTDNLTLNAIAILMAATSATELITVLIVAETSFVFRFRPFPWRFSSMAAMMRASAFFAVLSFVGILYFRIGVLVLGMSGADSSHNVAVYSLAGRIPEGLSFFPVAVVNAMIPFLSRSANDREAINSTFNILVKMIGLAALAAAAVLILCARDVILMIGKADYLPYINVFRIYGLTVFTAYLQYVLSNQLICMDREKQVARRYAICLALNLVLCTILAVRYGAIGAVSALLVCELVGLTLDATLLHKLGHSVGVNVLWSWLIMIVIIAASFGLSLFLPQGYRLPLVVFGGGAVLCTVAWREFCSPRHKTHTTVL